MNKWKRVLNYFKNLTSYPIIYCIKQKLFKMYYFLSSFCINKNLLEIKKNNALAYCQYICMLIFIIVIFYTKIDNGKFVRGINI